MQARRSHPGAIPTNGAVSSIAGRAMNLQALFDERLERAASKLNSKLDALLNEHASFFAKVRGAGSTCPSLPSGSVASQYTH